MAKKKKSRKYASMPAGLRKYFLAKKKKQKGGMDKPKVSSSQRAPPVPSGLKPFQPNLSSDGKLFKSITGLTASKSNTTDGKVSFDTRDSEEAKRKRRQNR